MLKFLLIATLSLGTVGFAQTTDNSNNVVPTQGAEDWYNQVLSAQVRQYGEIAAATAPSTPAANESSQPASMASNQGNSSEDWYNQELSKEVQVLTRWKDVGNR